MPLSDDSKHLRGNGLSTSGGNLVIDPLQNTPPGSAFLFGASLREAANQKTALLVVKTDKFFKFASIPAPLEKR